MNASPSPVLPSSFRALLRAELARRCANNPRYSLRAFARHLGIDHATLSQLLRGRRQITRAVIVRLGRRLGLEERQLESLAAVDAPAQDGAQAGIGELAARVAEDPVHHLFLALVAEGGLPPDTRRAARALGLTIDETNVILHRLTALGLLSLEGRDRWRDVEDLGRLPTDAFVRAVWRRATDAIRELETPSLPSTSKEPRMPDPVAQFQIVSKNPDRSAQFYASVFGWSVDAANPLGYRQVSTGAGGLAGGIWPAPAEAHSFVQLFIEVDDVAKAAERAKAAGARVLVPPQKLPEGDELAILADPEGVPLGVIARNERSRARRRPGRTAAERSPADRNR